MRRPGPGRAAILGGLLTLAAAWAPGVWAAGEPVSPAAISIDPACLEDATSDSPIAVAGSNFHPFSPVLVTFDAGPGGRPESVAERTDGFGRFGMQIDPRAHRVGVRTVRADDFKGREASTDLLVPCHPKLELSPPIGPPGFVTRAIGRDFPPGAAVRLTWSPGISNPRPVIADAGGRFRVPVIVFSGDVYGPRRLRAEPAGPLPFGTADTGFLVVYRSFLFTGDR